jgi:holin-like protein
MNFFGQAALIFGLCFAGDLLSPLIPVTIPGRLIAMILLFIILLLGWVKVRHIHPITDFLQKHMALFFLPPCVSVVQDLPLLKRVIVPLLAIGCISTVLTFWAAAAASAIASNLQARFRAGKSLEERHG